MAKVWTAAILVAALALSGCISATQGAVKQAGERPLGGDTLTAGSADLDDALAGLSGRAGFGGVEIVNSNDYGGEPGIDVSPVDGTVYINAPSGLGGAGGSWMYRKEADGSWHKCALTSGPGGGDSNAAINPWGRIAMNDLWLGSLTFYHDNKARCDSWIPNPVSTPVPVGDRQWVDYGWADCEYFQSWNQIPTGIHVQYTKDCGVTWIDAQVSPAMDLIGNLVVDHSGKTRNVYQFYTANGAIHVAIVRVSTGLLGDSLTYTTKLVAPAISGHKTLDSFPAGDVDAAGNVHVVWQDLYTTGKGKTATKDSQIRYAYSADGGSTFSAPLQISSGGSNVFPWIAAGAAGKVAAVWYHADKTGDPNNVAGPWYVHMAQTGTLGGAFAESRATPLSIHNDVICTGGTSCSGDDRDLLDFFEVDIGKDGYAVITFTKDTDASGNGNGEPRNAYVRQTSGDSLL